MLACPMYVCVYICIWGQEFFQVSVEWEGESSGMVLLLRPGLESNLFRVSLESCLTDEFSVLHWAANVVWRFVRELLCYTGMLNERISKDGGIWDGGVDFLKTMETSKRRAYTILPVHPITGVTSHLQTCVGTQVRWERRSWVLEEKR